MWQHGLAFKTHPTEFEDDDDDSSVLCVVVVVVVVGTVDLSSSHDERRYVVVDVKVGVVGDAVTAGEGVGVTYEMPATTITTT